MARSFNLVLVQIPQRIDGPAVDAYLEMKMRTGRIPGHANRADGLPALDVLADADKNL